MLGNCATGRAKMVSVPTITMTMEITMATMGRLMKNFDMELLILWLSAEGLGVHLHARTDLLNSFGNHAFAGLEPFVNNPIGADALADLDRADADFVLVVNHGDLIAA